ncbi:MAG: GNAT family N-acetyltransferase, partial [Acidimicrobiia bacterium]|nr:GNAT family N-acetyltransferase [Acidimicrobiia bacterium]
PLETDRLLIRSPVLTDSTALHARRNDPEVARLQDWTLPWGMERAEALIEEAVAMDGPTNDEWWMAIVESKGSGATLGDLAIFLSFEGQVAEIGYTFASEHWGKGYAVEAVAALIDWLFNQADVRRISAMVHPDNVASAQVLERNGFLWEGHTRMSYWVDGEGSDDWIYGLLPDDWAAWTKRPRHRPEAIRLVEIDHSNAEAAYELVTHRTQRAFVAPMDWSFADALFPEIYDGAPLVPWYRAVEADGELVGFVMLAWVTETEPEPYLWRLLVDRMHQRRGIGSLILEEIENVCRAQGWKTLRTSWVEGRGSPAPFYLKHGFVPTGEIEDGETVAAKDL